MTKWSLDTLFTHLHEDIESRLNTARKTLAHPGAKGDASENVWLKLLQEYLPERYKAEKAFVVDSKGVFSQQIDVVVFDRQYSPFIFKFEDQSIVPAESVYAVFEAKQSINADYIKYAQEKITSVRRLHRTSIPIPHAGGMFPAKPVIPIIGGILSLDSDWSPALGKPLKDLLDAGKSDSTLNLGCIAAHGIFKHDSQNNEYEFVCKDRAATIFILELISRLQFSGTVPMIDIQAYAKWLK
jgi:hypothetical protein